MNPATGAARCGFLYPSPSLRRRLHPHRPSHSFELQVLPTCLFRKIDAWRIFKYAITANSRLGRLFFFPLFRVALQECPKKASPFVSFRIAKSTNEPFFQKGNDLLFAIWRPFVSFPSISIAQHQPSVNCLSNLCCFSRLGGGLSHPLF